MNFPTWFSSMLLALAAFFSYQCSIAAKTPQRGQRMWQWAALGFLGMSCDEVAMIHESIGNTLNKYYFKSKAIEHSTWVIILGPIILVMLIVFIIKIKKYLRNSRKAKQLLMIGIFVYVGGSFFLEATINLLNHQNLQWLWNLEIVLEEFFEMLGTVIIIKGLMEHRDFLLTDKS